MLGSSSDRERRTLISRQRAATFPVLLLLMLFSLAWVMLAAQVTASPGGVLARPEAPAAANESHLEPERHEPRTAMPIRKSILGRQR